MNRRRFVVHGVVQGVGFRPFVHRLATVHGLTGMVENGSAGVTIEVEGAPPSLAAFRRALEAEAPRAAVITAVEETDLPGQGSTAFVIGASRAIGRARPVLPPDLATCDACLAELLDPASRRYRYPFTSCTDCGPRWSIATGAPWDRVRTTMDAFPPCVDCAREYADPADRRFHAQPIACAACGPRLWLTDATGAPLGSGDAALVAAAGALEAGEVVAVKGLGGWQLVVDASCDAAVARLRARKHRPEKPFAVLAPDLATAEAWAIVPEAAARALRSAASPIVLLVRRPGAPVVDGVSPGSRRLGVMLPTTPLHHLLVRAVGGRPLVCTSGNRSDEPMAIGDVEAHERLRGVADRFLGHDRRVVRPVDDTVVRFDADGPTVLRRARGFAPAPVPVAARGTVLALGGHQKSTITLLVDGEAVTSQHLGDLSGPAGVDLLERTVAEALALFGVPPEVVACDAHPDYASTRVAARVAAAHGARLVRVQHHHAHALAVAAEHGVRGPFLALAWDGAGHGTDGTVWGGEALAVDGAACLRVGTLRPFPLPGGDRAAREPRRSALGVWWAHTGAMPAAADAWFTEAERAAQNAALVAGVFPRTSSVGRLFDAVAALLGLRWARAEEGFAATRLEEAATGPGAVLPWGFAERDGLLEADPGPIVAALCASSAPVGERAFAFHAALADLAAAWAARAGRSTVVLTGGCFQNALLTRLVRERLAADGFRVLRAHRFPPNDGGLSLGQAVAAAWGAAP